MSVTAHAIERWIERVAPVAWAEAEAAMLAAAPIVDRAAAIGCSVVIIGNGARLVLDGATVVTVLGKGMVKTGWRLRPPAPRYAGNGVG